MRPYWSKENYERTWLQIQEGKAYRHDSELWKESGAQAVVGGNTIETKPIEEGLAEPWRE